MWAKIITIKGTKDLNYFSLCALNLFNTQVSQFELNYWNKWTFPQHSNLLRSSCITYCICKWYIPSCDWKIHTKDLSLSVGMSSDCSCQTYENKDVFMSGSPVLCSFNDSHHYEIILFWKPDPVIFWTFYIRNSSHKNICWQFTQPPTNQVWVSFFFRTDLEKCSIALLAHKWILCSEWVPAEQESWLGWAKIKCLSYF